MFFMDDFDHLKMYSVCYHCGALFRVILNAMHVSLKQPQATSNNLYKITAGINTIYGNYEKLLMSTSN